MYGSKQPKIKSHIESNTVEAEILKIKRELI